MIYLPAASPFLMALLIDNISVVPALKRVAAAITARMASWRQKAARTKTKHHRRNHRHRQAERGVKCGAGEKNAAADIIIGRHSPGASWRAEGGGARHGVMPRPARENNPPARHHARRSPAARSREHEKYNHEM